MTKRLRRNRTRDNSKPVQDNLNINSIKAEFNNPQVTKIVSRKCFAKNDTIKYKFHKIQHHKIQYRKTGESD